MVIMFISSYWSLKYDDDIMNDRIALNLLFVQVSACSFPKYGAFVIIIITINLFKVLCCQ